MMSSSVNSGILWIPESNLPDFHAPHASGAAEDWAFLSSAAPIPDRILYRRETLPGLIENSRCRGIGLDRNLLNLLRRCWKVGLGMAFQSKGRQNGIPSAKTLTFYKETG